MHCFLITALIIPCCNRSWEACHLVQTRAFPDNRLHVYHIFPKALLYQHELPIRPRPGRVSGSIRAPAAWSGSVSLDSHGPELMAGRELSRVSCYTTRTLRRFLKKNISHGHCLPPAGGGWRGEL